MDKWKIIVLILVAAISVTSAIVAGALLFEPSSVEPSGTEEILKPKFHIYDVNLEGVEAEDWEISFKMQNLGNVSATEVVVAYEMKLSGYDMTFYHGEDLNGDGSIDEEELEEIPSIWLNDTVNVAIVESKETNEYYIDNLFTRMVAAGNVTLSRRNPTGTIIILESHWNITCAEAVSEQFDF